MIFKILSIFPDIFSSYIKEGIIKRAIEKKQIKIESYNLRDFSKDKHKKVDDSPYGGGPGMLMNIEPLYLALNHLNKKKSNKKKKIVLLSASGKKWDQKLAKKYSKFDELILICGRYEGVDSRIKHFIDEEISIGDYILTGGELPALVMIDSVTRLLPGVLGNKDSSLEESHSDYGILEYPQYTRPAVFTANSKNYKVPKVLLSGNHKEIKSWRKKKTKTKKKEM